MPNLTTGLLENGPVAGVRPSSTLSVNISNNDTIPVFVVIQGFYQSGSTKTLYVLEEVVIPVGGVALKNYYAQLDTLEFQFITSSNDVGASVWGKDETGALTTAHRVVAKEEDLF